MHRFFWDVRIRYSTHRHRADRRIESPPGGGGETPPLKKYIKVSNEETPLFLVSWYTDIYFLASRYNDIWHFLELRGIS